MVEQELNGLMNPKLNEIMDTQCDLSTIQEYGKEK